MVAKANTVLGKATEMVHTKHTASCRRAVVRARRLGIVAFWAERRDRIAILVADICGKAALEINRHEKIEDSVD